MKSKSWKYTLLLLVIALGAMACSVDAESEDEYGLSTGQLTNPGYAETWRLYEWYVEQGATPCDPPPDPWSPFVQHGCCDNVNFEHDVIPSQSFDE